MFFLKRAPKQKGGCLDTLNTPWIRHCWPAKSLSYRVLVDIVSATEPFSRDIMNEHNSVISTRSYYP